jgi:hypothetical protein
MVCADTGESPLPTANSRSDAGSVRPETRTACADGASPQVCWATRGTVTRRLVESGPELKTFVAPVDPSA